jgi:hypothetical protein
VNSPKEPIPDKDDFLLEVLEFVHPEAIDKLLAIAKQEGKPIAEIITEALWLYFKETGAIERYRQAQGLADDWPWTEGAEEEPQTEDEL